MTSRSWIAALVLLGLVLVVYGQAGGLGYVDLDDAGYVASNQAVLSGLSAKGLRYAFMSTDLGNWHPLTWLSHMFVVELAGPRPAAHHWTNVALHVLATWLCFGWLQSSTRQLGASFVAAAIFAVHPLRVESVAWIAERKDVLSGAFFFGSLWAWGSFTRAPTRLRYWSAWLLFVLGLGSKSMLVTLPVVLLLVDRWPLRRPAPWVALILEKLPFFIASAAFAGLALWTQAGSEAIGDLDAFPLADRVVNALDGLWFYVDRSIWPRDLAVFYPIPESIPVLSTVVVVAFVLILTVAAWVRRERAPLLFAGWLWFLVTLAPVVGIIQIGLQAHADRYAYLPQMGLILIGVWGLAGWSRAKPRAALTSGSLAGVVILGCAIFARQQVSHWETNEKLFGHALAVTEDNYFAHVKFGSVRVRQKRDEEAIEHFEAALEIEPDYTIAHNNLGTALFRRGEIQEAIGHFEEAVRIWPDNFEPLANLAAAWASQGRDDLADEYARRALELRPEAVALMRYVK